MWQAGNQKYPRPAASYADVLCFLLDFGSPFRDSGISKFRVILLIEAQPAHCGSVFRFGLIVYVAVRWKFTDESRSCVFESVI